MKLTLLSGLLVPVLAAAQGAAVPPFAAEVRTVFDASSGLPADDVFSVAADDSGEPWAATAAGLVRYHAGRWSREGAAAARVAASPRGVWFAADGALWRMEGNAPRRRIAALPPETRHIAGGESPLISAGDGLYRLAGGRLVRDTGLPAGEVRQAAIAADGSIAAASSNGLYLLRRGGAWRRLLPRTATRSWAPDDVRGVAFDSRGRLWFASPQGAGCLDGAQW
ncbi:MAG: hypothetical protein KGN36_16460, partial [Acidobacteriota bacterium]|nr:hypothetical protein [Acidobacteriota bacterium]